MQDCCRVGTKREEATRPVKFSLSSSDMVTQVLRKARLLRSKEGYKPVYICPDRTVEERMAYRKLTEALIEKRKAGPDKLYIIKNNKIVSSAKDSLPALPGRT